MYKFLCFFILLISLIGCSKEPTSNPNKIIVGASSTPHAIILKQAQKELSKLDIQLEIREISDYVQPNVLLYEKQLDANFFQHEPYLEGENERRGMNLVKVANVHLEPMGAYSKTLKHISELKDAAIVAIPNDETNEGRALLLLEKQGLIKINDQAGIRATIKDITDNPKKLKFKELEAAIIPRAYGEVDLALINTNYALQINLLPTKDALFLEDKHSPYVNILVAREDNAKQPKIQKLAKILSGSSIRKFIETQFHGEIIPAF